MLVQLEDVLAEVEQANLPGTTDAHPNWCRQLSRGVEEIVGSGGLHRVAGLIKEARPALGRRMSEAGRQFYTAIRATYRLQFHRQFTFRDATDLVAVPLRRSASATSTPSPIMEARPGSTHGYDIIDHNRLNPEIGTEADFSHAG